MNKYLIIGILMISFITSAKAQTANEIVHKSDQNARGNSQTAIINITIVRPKWTKKMSMKSWAKGNEYMASVILKPAKEKGIVYLMREKEIWNYMPSINRTIKLPPSMMMQSWMGTDMTNDDLIKQSSLVKDYNQKIIAEEKMNGLDVWKIELIPHENATVVWGKILIWIDKKDYMQLKIEFYDEDNFLVNTMNATAFGNFDGRKLPSVFEYVPADKKGQKTIIEYQSLKFDMPIDEQIFSSNYMKRLR